MAPRVLLVPFPITPLVSIGYYLLCRLGIVVPPIAVRYYDAPAGKSVPLMLGNGAVLSIAWPDLYPYLKTLLEQMPAEERRFAKRLLDFCQSGDQERGHRFSRWLAELQLSVVDPRMVLERAARLFKTWHSLDINPWRQGLEIPEVVGAAPVPRAYPPDKRFGTFPVFKQEDGRVKPGEREVIATANYELAEGLIWELATAHIGVVVGGPPGSGKSTIAASLAAEMRHQIASLATRRGWKRLSLSVEVANLDLATPTVDEIADGIAKRDPLELRRRKRPWTEALAYEALNAFVRAKRRASIVIADLPGKISPLTEIVAAPADAAILITKDWSLMRDWQDFARRMGIPTIAQARSRRSAPDTLSFSAELTRLLRRLLGLGGEEEVGFTSVVTSYRADNFIAGRVVDLDRMERSYDRFILWVAECLLFGILPARVIRRREKLEKILRSPQRP